MLAARDASRLAEELVVQTSRAGEALRFSPLLRYSPFRRTARTDIERFTRGVGALAAGLAHTRVAARAAWHASGRLQVSLDAAPVGSTGDWPGLLEHMELALTQFAGATFCATGP